MLPEAPEVSVKPLLPACAALFLVAAPAARACTTAVISGKATKDGRPLLWKNRDASDLHNQVVYREDGRYPYLAVVNRGDRAALQVWSGINAAGFAIMNNASYNLATDGDKTVMEGAFMKLALQSCATVEDFQELLRLTDAGGREVAANFGVIDAKGGAAYFETDARGFRRFDAAGAKGGFLVRSNYSHSGRKGAGTGFLREARAQALLEGLQAAGRLEAGPLLAEVARDTANAHIGSFPAQTRKGFAPIQDAISRGESSHAFLVQGVRPGEAPERSTAWVILGLPVTGVAVPLWVAARSVPAELAAGPQLAPMNAAFDRARRHLYPERTGDLARYLDAGRLYDPASGLLAPFLAREAANLAAVEAALSAPKRPDLATLQARLAAETLRAVREALAARQIPEA
jgi:hypothetical protein